MNDIKNKRCVPCGNDNEPLKDIKINDYLKSLDDNWRVLDNIFLEKIYKFQAFLDGLEFINDIAKLSEEEGHHPELTISWAKVIVRLTTYKIKGIHENDFILAAKIDDLYNNNHHQYKNKIRN